MKKIMFNDKYGLTNAVLKGRKTMTRRAVGNRMTDDDIKAYLKGYTELADKAAPYKIGEVLAVAQPYKDLDYSLKGFAVNPDRTCGIRREFTQKQAGWNNKMFVSAKFMPHYIRITDIKVERVQDISEEDCLKEGIIRRDDMINSQMEDVVRYTFENSFVDGVYKTYATPREAFAALIERPGIGHKGDWSRNNWVFVYTFGLIK